MYAVTATLTKADGAWNRTTQIPTFYLDEIVLGIVSEDHASRIAESIVNPFGEFTAHITAVNIGEFGNA